MPFVTPNNLPTSLFCRQILIPNDPYWIGLVSGALIPFTYASEWKQEGGITPDEAAARWLEMVNQYWNSTCEGENGMPCEGGCPEVLKRVNPDTAQLEISTDGGSTWRTDPASPITQIYAQPPPVPAGVSATACDAATNGKVHIEDIIAATSSNLATAVTVFDLAVAVCVALLDIFLIVVSAGALTAPATALAAAIWGAARAVFELGQEAFDAYWTTPERDKILCALYCNIQPDGSFTQAGYDRFITKWKADATPSVAFNMVLQSVKTGGLKGLNNLCSYGIAADEDCSDCGCNCDTSMWDAYPDYGTDVTRGTDEDGFHYIEADAVAHGSNYYIIFTTGDAEKCCEFMSWTFITPSEPPENVISWCLCSETPTTGECHSGVLTSGNINSSQLQAAVPFRGRLTFV